MKYAVAAVLFCCSLSLAAAAPATVPVRQPKYPLKSARTLHTDEEIARARQNVKQYPSAKKIADGVIAAADKWIEWPDEDLRFLLTSWDVPRAFAVSAAGCPKCGGKIIEKTGSDYGWIIDPKLPFKVTCPVDGSVYPTNDFERYYRSGFKEKIGWDSAYVDDGWGAPADAGKSADEKFWFVAYYNHWMWHKHLVPGLHALASAYTITGDRKYAHKAAVMLHRVAEVYPGMNHATQSRYGALEAARGRTYNGKVVNNIWETGLAQSLAEAYDAVWETIDADAELQQQAHKSGEQIRAFIEANVLEDAIDAYFQGKIRGNFGMHQSALVRLAQVRQHGQTRQWFDGLMNENSPDYQSLGLNFAIYNLVSRDGVPMEGAPGYNSIWVKEIADYGDVLHRAGRDVFTDRRAKRMFDAVLDQMHLGGTFTASAGDSGSVHGGVVGADPQTFQIASRYYNDPRYAALLAKMKASGANSFRSWDALFRPPVEAPPDVKPAPAPARPRLLDGGGLAILNNKADTISLALSYGQTHGHGHYDRLNFELFANGLPMLPDLGYPDAMNQFVPGIYTWSKNTIAHNTVVVDGRRQFGTQAGDVKMFASGDFARGVDVEAKQTYGQCSSYRRAMIMVDAPGDSAGNSYFVDVFTVAGGAQHDYSLHGPPGKFEMIGGQWSDPAKGTLAGENVALGAIYDDEKLAAAKGGFAAYAGSGFQHLFNVRTLQNDGGGAGGWVAQFKHERDENAMVRLRILDQPDMKMMLCDARVSPVKDPRVLKYLIARRTGPEPLASRFVSVIEPFREKPFIRSVTPLKLDDDEGGAGVAIAVERVDGQTDVVMYDPAGARKRLRARGIDTRAEIAVTTFAADEKRPTRSFRVFATVAPGRASVAKVVGVMPISSAIEIAAADPNRPFDAADLPGRVIHFVNDRHRTAHTVASVARVPDSNHYLLTLADDIVVGLAKVDKIQADELTTATALPLISAYRGATLADDLFRFQHPLKYARNGTIKLASPLPANHPIKPGDNVWLMDVGVGDLVEMPLIRDIKLK